MTPDQAGQLGARVKRMGDVLDALGISDEVYAVLRSKAMPLKSVLSAARHPHIVDARQWLQRVLRDQTKWSYPYIGELFSQDHTTVMASVKQDREREEPFAATPTPRPLGDNANERARIAKQLQAHADELHKTKHPAAAEVERIAGVIRRGEGIE